MDIKILDSATTVQILKSGSLAKSNDQSAIRIEPPPVRQTPEEIFFDVGGISCQVTKLTVADRFLSAKILRWPLLLRNAEMAFLPHYGPLSRFKIVGRVMRS